MKVLDRYIVRELVGPIIYATVTLIFLILIADLFDNLDDLIRHKTPIAVIFKYYASLVPHAFIQIIPWSTWLATLFLLVNFGFNSETIAMKAAGPKITTIIRPIVFTGFLIGILTFLISDRVVPSTYQTANELREIHIEKKKKKESNTQFRNVTYYTKGDELYYFRSYDSLKKSVKGAVVLWLKNEDRNRRKKMIAQSGKHVKGKWEFRGVTEYQMDSRGRILGEPRTYEKRAYPEIKFSPEDLATASSESTFLSYKELKNWIGKLKENGVKVNSEIVDLQFRLSAPWHGLVMMLITVPLLAKTTQRKAIALNVLICVGLIFAYHVSGAVAMALGKAGKLFPFLSAWAGNIVFSAGALAYLDKANY